jgi:hypothetical protein
MARKQAKQERIAEALDLRARGKSYREIAAFTGVSVRQAFEDVKQGLADHRESYAETAADVRGLELARLDRLWRRAEDLLESDDDDGAKAIGAALRIMERRARLLGLDAQVEQVAGSVTLTVEVPSPTKAGAD